MTNETKTWQTVKGTEVKYGDLLLADSGTSEVVLVSPGMHKFGARFVDALLANGEIERCWERFQYRVAR